MKNVLIFVLCLFLNFAHAKTYKVYLGTSPGSASDIQTRKLFDDVSRETGDTFIVLNKPGANFLVAYKSFIEDSKTNKDVILFNTSSIMLTAYVNEPTLGIDPINDVKGLMMLQKVNYFLAVREDSVYKNLSDIKGKINIAITSSVSELLVKKYLVGVDYQIIPYKSENESMAALLKGEVDVASTHNINTLLNTQKEKFRILKPYPQNMIGTVGYSVPLDFPEDDKKRLNRAMNNALKTEEFNNMGVEFVGGSGEKYDEQQKKTLGEIIKLKDRK